MADKQGLTAVELQRLQKVLVFKLSVLSGLYIKFRERDQVGRHMLASNGKEFIALPLSRPMTEEEFLINIKNICKANDIDFNKYFDAHQDYVKQGNFDKAPAYFDELTNEIVEKLKTLPQEKRGDRVTDLWAEDDRERDLAEKYDSNKGKIDSVKKYRIYCRYFEQSKEIRSISTLVPEQDRQAFADAEMEIVETLKEVSLEHQKKAIENLREDPKLKDLNDKELD